MHNHVTYLFYMFSSSTRCLLFLTLISQVINGAWTYQIMLYRWDSYILFESCQTQFVLVSTTKSIRRYISHQTTQAWKKPALHDKSTPFGHRNLKGCGYPPAMGEDKMLLIGDAHFVYYNNRQFQWKRKNGCILLTPMEAQDKMKDLMEE